MSRTELLNKIATLTGGRAAEELVFGADNMTTGAPTTSSRPPSWPGP